MTSMSVREAHNRSPAKLASVTPDTATRFCASVRIVAKFAVSIAKGAKVREMDHSMRPLSPVIQCQFYLHTAMNVKMKNVIPIKLRLAPMERTDRE